MVGIRQPVHGGMHRPVFISSNWASTSPWPAPLPRSEHAILKRASLRPPSAIKSPAVALLTAPGRGRVPDAVPTAGGVINRLKSQSGSGAGAPLLRHLYRFPLACRLGGTMMY